MVVLPFAFHIQILQGMIVRNLTDNIHTVTVNTHTVFKSTGHRDLSSKFRLSLSKSKDGCFFRESSHIQTEKDTNQVFNLLTHILAFF